MGLQLLIRSGCLAHTLGPAWPETRLGVRLGLGSGAFSLANGLPSATSAGDGLLLFGCFVGTNAAIRLPAAVHEGLMAHRLLPPARQLPAGGHGISRFSRMEFLCMLGVFDSAGPRHTRAVVRRVVAFLAI